MKYWFYIFFAFLFLSSCATPSSPQGGPQDKDAPNVTGYQPQFLTKNFSQKDITIVFDEWIQIANIKQNVIISPPVNPEPSIIAKKNELKIHFKEALDSNTTYSIFFGDAVKDNNEGNLINNLSYVFSTGDFIDSLSISGQLISLDGNILPENVFIELYTSSSDSIITKERPKYIYKVNKEGSFKLEYLPKDTFYLFALNDLNTNYLYDLPTEWVGKLGQPILLDSNIKNIQVSISLPESENFKVINFNSTLLDQKVTIELNKELNPQKDTISLKNLSTGKIIPFDQKFTSKKFTFLNVIDSTSTSCELTINGIILDTLKLKQPLKLSENVVFLPFGQINVNDSILRALDNQDFQFISSLPVYQIDTSKILLISNSDTAFVSIFTFDSSSFDFSLNLPLPENFTGRLVFLDSALKFSSGQFSTSKSYPINYSVKELYGQVHLNILLPSVDTSYVIRIFHSNNRLEYETTVVGDSTFQYIIPSSLSGDYFVEVIEDLNNSATWNGSSFWKSLPPEKVFKSEKYSVKPNWENEYKVVVRFDTKQLPTPIVHLLDLLIHPTKENTNKSNPLGPSSPSAFPQSSPSLNRGMK